MPDDIGFLLKVIKDNMERHFNQAYRPEALTSSQVHVLRYLRERGVDNRITQKEIENYLHVSHPTVVGILQRLESKGFIRTGFDGEDKRHKYVYVTEKEAAFHQRMKDSRGEMEQLLTRGMTPQEVGQLKGLLTIVYHNVSSEKDVEDRF